MKKMICSIFRASLLLLFILPCSTIAQVNVSGIINAYVKVTAVDTCKNMLTISSFAGFNKGDEVMLIQMKSAAINEGQSNVYGNLINLRSAGLYEINVIDSMYGDKIILKNKFINLYYPALSLQLVNIPKLQNAVVTDSLTAKKWDGDTGGILAFNIIDNLTLDGILTVTGKGFRGGKANPQTDPTNACTWLLTVSDYWTPQNNWRAAEKGEGIAAFTAGKEAGRGPQYNGGGGGNDHNSGGGGGSHIGAGGNGATNNGGSTFDCKGPNPGIGGRAIANITNRIYFGGGGGAGHGNNGAATSGGDGGGILFVKGKKITANGTKIFANGGSAKDTYWEGGGGGGAGGTVILDIEEVAGNLKVESKGGIGGSTDNTGSDHCYGNGGGGAGGRIIVTTILSASYDVDFGKSGVAKNGNCNGGKNGATDGKIGLFELNQFLPYSKQKNINLSITKQMLSDTVCTGNTTAISIEAAGTGLSYQWYNVTPNGNVKVSDTGIFSGSKTDKLNFINPVSLSNNEFYCEVTSVCGDKVSSKNIKVFLTDPPKATFSFSKINTLYNFINGSTNGKKFEWDFGDGATSTEQNPSHLFTQDGEFTVELVVYGDCGVALISQIVKVVTPPVAVFKVDTTQGCAPFLVKPKNLSSDNSKFYKWRFEGASIDSSDLKEPVVTYLKSGIYSITLEVSNDEFNNSTTKKSYIIVSEKPAIDIGIKQINNGIVTFSNATKNATDYFWDFGNGITDLSKEPTHAYKKDGVYEVKMTATNDCGTVEKTITVQIEALPKAKFTTNLKKGCVPFTVQFNDQTPQTVLTRKWTFEGAKIDTSSQQNPTVLYEKAGTFAVTLVVKNIAGKDSIVAKDYITVGEKPIFDVVTKVEKLQIEAKVTSTNSINYEWTFIDATKITNGTSENFSVTASKSGSYTLKLEVRNQCGSNIFTKNIAVSNELPCGEITLTTAPNPALEFLQITLNATRKNDSPYLWTTIDGKIIESGLWDKNILRKEIDVQALADGIYIFYYDCDGRKISRKIVVARP
jgi:PKD repeat protein